MAKEITKDNFRSLKLADMMEYIAKNAPEKKKDFAQASYVKNAKTGKDQYSHLKALNWFVGEFYPECLPKKKEKTADVLKDWLK